MPRQQDSALPRATLRRKLTPLLRGVACLCLLYHLAALTFANFPKRSVLSDDIHAPFDVYLSATAQWQIWNMFTTRPRLLAIAPSIEVQWPDKTKEQFPALLPGPSPYTGELKLYAFMTRVVVSSDDASGVTRYAAALCRAIEAQRGTKPSSVQLVIAAETIAAPVQIRKSGKIATTHTQRSRVVSCK